MIKKLSLAFLAKGWDVGRGVVVLAAFNATVVFVIPPVFFSH